MDTTPSPEMLLLEEVNAGLPDLDWKAGARAYVQGFFDRYTREQIESFIHTKPLAQITPEDPTGSLQEDVAYLFNFASTLKLLKLPRGSKILDVACGGGWVSHWLMKVGYEPVGFDISSDFISLARARVARDPDIQKTEGQLDQSFLVHDIEVEPLPPSLNGRFDAVILESCLHHFVNPVAVLRHLGQTLAPMGVMLIIEGENRQGPIREEYMSVMRETSTLERPYARSQLARALDLAGLQHRVFLGSVEGFAPETAEAEVIMTFRASAAGRNTCVCASSEASLRRLGLHQPSTSSSVVASSPETSFIMADVSAPETPPAQPESALVCFATAVKLACPAWLRPLLAQVWHLLRARTRPTHV